MREREEVDQKDGTANNSQERKGSSSLGFMHTGCTPYIAIIICPSHLHMTQAVNRCIRHGIFVPTQNIDDMCVVYVTRSKECLAITLSILMCVQLGTKILYVIT